MISGESAPGFLIQFPLKACRLFYQIHAPQSALDAQITQEGVSRNRNVDSILEKIAIFFARPPIKPRADACAGCRTKPIWRVSGQKMEVRMENKAISAGAGLPRRFAPRNDTKARDR